MSRVEGLARLRAKLRDLPEVAKDEIRKALEENAEEIVRLARSLAPRKTGALRNSIGWTYGSAPKGSIAIAQAETGEGDLRITVYAGDEKAFYARWVEFGRAGVLPRPFFYPSYRAVRRRARGRLTRATKRAARKVAGQA